MILSSAFCYIVHSMIARSLSYWVERCCLTQAPIGERGPTHLTRWHCKVDLRHLSPQAVDCFVQFINFGDYRHGESLAFHNLRGVTIQRGDPGSCLHVVSRKKAPSAMGVHMAVFALAKDLVIPDLRILAVQKFGECPYDVQDFIDCTLAFYLSWTNRDGSDDMRDKILNGFREHSDLWDNPDVLKALKTWDMRELVQDLYADRDQQSAQLMTVVKGILDRAGEERTTAQKEHEDVYEDRQLYEICKRSEAKEWEAKRKLDKEATLAEEHDRPRTRRRLGSPSGSRDDPVDLT